MKKKIKETIVRKQTKKWIEENAGLLKDYYEICHSILMFEAMWGIGIGIVFKDREVRKGREMGVDSLPTKKK